jgi:Big-like domain-containing protein
VAGRDYRIAVAGVEGGLAASEGTFTINVAYAPSSNDDLSGARALSGNSVKVNGTTLAATREFGEPDHYTTTPDSFWWIGEHSVWYSWTAPFSGQVEMNTCTTDIDSILAVYTGNDMSTINRVVDDRNSCPDAYGSKVTFNATAGTTYRIAVADTGGDYMEDTFTLEVVDKKPPTVTSTSPANNATGLARGANVKATFSEPMRASTITGSTFRLIKQGATSNVSAAVTYDSATNVATLNPNTNLTAGATYTAAMTTQTKDLAGNGLDQDPNTAGNQAKSWRFKVQP